MPQRCTESRITHILPKQLRDRGPGPSGNRDRAFRVVAAHPLWALLGASDRLSSILFLCFGDLYVFRIPFRIDDS